jgi:tetratricopeptide (TPR) repeat protein
LEAYLREANPDVDPGDVADARQKFAAIELSRGHVARADQLLTQAESFWRSVAGQYAEERLEGLGIRARQQRAAGDLEGAIATTRTAIEQRTALSGRVHRETAVLTNSYGIILTAAHRLPEALAAYRDTLAIYRALGLGDELDAQIVLANTGILEMRTGHLREAETTLEDAIGHERALAGNSAAVAAALGNYGKVLLLQGRPEQALPTLHEATDLGARYAGPTSPVAVQNRLFLGEAQLATGDRTAARATLTDDYEAAKGQYGPENPLTLRTELALARVMIAQGHRSDAQAQLLAIIPALRRKGVQVEEELAEAQALLNDLQSSTRQVPQAHGTTTPGP